MSKPITEGSALHNKDFSKTGKPIVSPPCPSKSKPITVQDVYDDILIIRNKYMELCPNIYLELENVLTKITFIDSAQVEEEVCEWTHNKSSPYRKNGYITQCNKYMYLVDGMEKCICGRKIQRSDK